MFPTFDRAWRAAYLAQLRSLLPGQTREKLQLLSLPDSLAALGRSGEENLGVQEVPVDQIVGSASRAKDFDRQMRPRSPHLRERWETIAHLDRPLPPVSLVRLDELYFVEDGHHRVSIARAQRAQIVEARVHRIRTIVCANRHLTVADLPAKNAERMFLERVPLPDDARVALQLDCPTDWQLAAEAAEAWGFRRTIDGEPMRDRCQLATTWWNEEVTPVLRQLRCRGIATSKADLSAFLHHRQVDA